MPSVFCHENLTVDFYRTLSTSSDSKMISMTQDLFYTQLSSIEGITVIDNRDQNYNAQSKNQASSEDSIAFYTEINESSDSQSEDSWVCTVYSVNNKKGLSAKKSGTYASYYKILMDAKNLISAVLDEAQEKSSLPESKEKSAESATTISNAESLSGSWASSELFIDKVMILRGGRGFVIFKNGATMNISIKINGQEILVTQTGRPNASFFPELPREIALENAANAEPVTWLLTLNGNGLKGTKSTLVMQNGNAIQGSVTVEWTRK